MALRSAIDAGVRISLHNDGYFTPPEPIGSMSTAVNRRAQGSGRQLGPAERITVDEAMHAVTINATWISGKKVDLAALEGSETK